MLTFQLNKLSRELQASFNSTRIVETLKFLAQGVHVAGTPDNAFVMGWLAEQVNIYLNM